jgi:hypothetical protein
MMQLFVPTFLRNCHPSRSDVLGNCHPERSEGSASSLHTKADSSGFALGMTISRSGSQENCHPERSEGSAFELAFAPSRKADSSGFALGMTVALFMYCINP